MIQKISVAPAVFTVSASIPTATRHSRLASLLNSYEAIDRTASLSDPQALSESWEEEDRVPSLSFLGPNPVS